MMANSPFCSTDLRLLLPEVIWLVDENFQQAREMSSQVRSEEKQWQIYLQSLGLFAFEQWLGERITDKTVNRDSNVTEAFCNLRLGEFKLCLMVTENILDEVVNLPQNVIDQPELAAHFYVVLEVLEEQEQVIIRGFLRYDEIVSSLIRCNVQLKEDGCYQLPLSVFDAEPNHLLFYSRFLEPASIPLPVATTETKATQIQGYLNKTTTVLSQWLEGMFDSAWLSFDALINPEANLALSTRNAQDAAKRGKLIDLGIQLGSQTVVLLVNITEEPEDKLGILIQLHPTGEERYLPPLIKLTLLSKAGKTFQEVTSRYQDNYIQLKPFKGELGKRFSIEVSLGDVKLKEDFEL